MKPGSVALFAGMVGFASVQLVSAAEAATFKERVEWSFGNDRDGQYPRAGLIDVNGMLYGTTPAGGNTGCNGVGCGTVFSLDPGTGTEKVLYSFCSRPHCGDGAVPTAGLIDVNGMLYGTTELGARNAACRNHWGCGTVFALDPNTRAEKVLYSFCDKRHCRDGAYPSASLTAVNGTLYGTTDFGGAHGGGTAFSLAPSTGAEKVLYSFCSQQNCADGAYPSAGVIDVKGTLYGTTGSGGGTGCGGGGCGTAFALDPDTGTEKVVYTFCRQPNCADGEYPIAIRIDASGKLYGTTVFGGVTGCFGNGCGTVFSLDPDTGAEKVVYSFCQQPDCADGALPYAGVIDVKGTLYGTTGYGGHTGCPQTGDCGTVFSVHPDKGTETVLYDFCSRKNCTDGWGPSASLIAVKGTLYGTTPEGGVYGYGTVFALKKTP